MLNPLNNIKTKHKLFPAAKATAQKTQRLRYHDLDSLRAIMMILGVFFHAATFYMTQSIPGYPGLQSSPTEPSFNVVAMLIQSFRMPLFFFIAGFFGALLFNRKGALNMVKNRVSRILFPFLVFWPPIFILLYTEFQYIVSLHPEYGFPFNAENIYNADTLLSALNTYHLWFLYHLMLLYIAALILEFALNKLTGFRILLKAFAHFTMQNPWRQMMVAVLFSSVVHLLFQIESIVHLPFSHGIELLALYATYFLVGWLTFYHRGLLTQYSKGYFWKLVAGLSMVLLAESTIDTLSLPHSLLKIIGTWFIVFGWLGFFKYFFCKYSRVNRYISDASYWIYLSHYPIATLICILLIDVELFAWGKYSIVVTGTLALTFLSYHYFVRSGVIGKLLNGRKYPKSLPSK